MSKDIERLKQMNMYSQASENRKNIYWLAVCLPIIFIVGGIVYRANAPYYYDYMDECIYNAIPPLAGFVLCLLLSIASVWFVIWLNKKMYSEWNQIVDEARVAVAEDKKAKAAALAKMEREKQAQEYHKQYEDDLNKYGQDFITINIGDNKSKRIMISQEHSFITFNGDDYKFSDIIDFKVTDNAEEIYRPAQYETKTDTGSMLGRAVVGGLLTGGVGAVIGGATASKTTVQTAGEYHTTIHDYKVIVYINDMNHPKVTINTEDNEKLTERIVSHLTVIVNGNRKKEAEKVQQVQQINNVSVADELRKLAELKKEGILSEEEFEGEKRKLLGK